MITTREVKKPKKEKIFGITEDDITTKGVHLGHITSKLHPGMKPYIIGVKNNVHILDSQKIAEKLIKALRFIEKIISEEKKIILVGARIPIKKLIKETAKECDIFYINERWLGGTFTNFETISKRIKYFNELEEKKQKGEFSKYTKKEQLKIDQELKKLRLRFDGIKKMEKLPDVVFIVDMKNNELVAREAKNKGIIVIGLCDTNVNPKLADYPVPGNNDSITSVKYILGKLKEAILEAKNK